jgi:hypothetical protein
MLDRLGVLLEAASVRVPSSRLAPRTAPARSLDARRVLLPLYA